MKTEYGARDDAQSAESAGDKFREIIAGHVLDDFSAAAGKRAIGKSDGDADDEVPQGAEAKTKRAAVVGGEDASDSGFFRPQRIERKELAVLGEGLLQLLDGATSFDNDGEVGPGVFDDLFQSCCGEDEVGAQRRIAPAEFCSAATRNHRETGFAGDTKGSCELLFGRRFEDELRVNTGECVGGRGRADMVGTEEGDEFVAEGGGNKGR